MTPSIDLDPEQRTALLDRYRKDPDPEVRFRSHILLLLADGHTWATVCSLLFCSSRTIDRWVRRFREEGIEAGGPRPPDPFDSPPSGSPSPSSGSPSTPRATSASSAADGAARPWPS
jgi:hypothetical protein